MEKKGPGNNNRNYRNKNAHHADAEETKEQQVS